MADFLPFAGIRYDERRLAGGTGAVVAPPYDVVDEEHRAALEATSPYNSVRLILPRGEGERDRYQVAAATIDAWLADGILVPDEQPRFYGYRMEFADEAGRRRGTHGVVGALALPEPGAVDVLPHERTLPKAKTDRLALLRATRANLDPIWCLSLAGGLSNLLGRDRPTLTECVDTEGVRHVLTAIDAPDEVATLTELVSQAPIVIADGHHRFETAGAYREERDPGSEDPGAGRIMAFVVELSDDELSVQPIHRLLSGLDGSVRGDLTPAFEVVDAGSNAPDRVQALVGRMDREGGLGLVDQSGLALLVPRSDVVADDLARVEAPLGGVDAARFDVAIRPLLPKSATVAYRHDAAAVATLVEKGAADAAVLLRPVTVGQIRDAAFAGVRMPEKTSFFHPKPRTGLVLRSLNR